MAIAETGMGKTAVFLIPIIGHYLEKFTYYPNMIANPKSQYTVASPKVLIVAPTRELAVQIARNAESLAVDTCLKDQIALVYGGASMDDQAESLSRGCVILVATIGRLLDFIHRNMVKVDEVEFLVIDESDRQLMDGFEESLNQLLRLPELPSTRDRVTVMTSATMSNEVSFLAQQQLNENFCYCLVGGLNEANTNIKQEIIKCQYQEKFKNLVMLLNDPEIKNGRTIVFMNQRRRCQTFSIQLG